MTAESLAPHVLERAVDNVSEERVCAVISSFDARLRDSLSAAYTLPAGEGLLAPPQYAEMYILYALAKCDADAGDSASLAVSGALFNDSLREFLCYFVRENTARGVDIVL